MILRRPIPLGRRHLSVPRLFILRLFPIARRLLVTWCLLVARSLLEPRGAAITQRVRFVKVRRPRSARHPVVRAV